MEKGQEKTLCRIRDIYRSIATFEAGFEGKYDICLNEGMLLCSLNGNKYSSSELAEVLGLTNSNTSKVIKSVEKKGLVKRNIGKDDKRQMYFTLTDVGKAKLDTIKCEDIEVPELLKAVIEV
ncbi:MAG: DNA-binding protein [Bacteroidetes bacterium]|nr:DNA-binding protein [Bacteroidota bacterium]